MEHSYVGSNNHLQCSNEQVFYQSSATYRISASRVSLLSSTGEVVGIASTIDGTLLHGKEISSGCTKVMIDHIQPGLFPPGSFIL